MKFKITSGILLLRWPALSCCYRDFFCFVFYRKVVREYYQIKPLQLLSTLVCFAFHYSSYQSVLHKYKISWRCYTQVFPIINRYTLVNGNAVPLQAWSGPEGSRKLRLPDFVTTAQDGGKVVSLTPAGIEPATIRFVARHLNHCATAVPHKDRTSDLPICSTAP